MNIRILTPLCAAALAAATLMAPASVQAATAQELLAQLNAQAPSPGNAGRGQTFFTSKHGKEWSCSSCHTSSPLQAGQHAATGKTIQPLAPAANAQRFTDTAKVEKWLRRNCNDVVGRECNAQEKADILAWLTSVQ